MRYVIRGIVIIVALAVLFLNPVVATSSTGTTTVLLVGAIIDLLAVTAIVASLVTLRHHAA